MKYVTEIHTTTCCHARMPDSITGKERDVCVENLNAVISSPCRLKDGIVVERDSLENMDRDDLPIEFCEMIDYLLNFRHADEYLFHP